MIDAAVSKRARIHIVDVTITAEIVPRGMES